MVVKNKKVLTTRSAALTQQKHAAVSEDAPENQSNAIASRPIMKDTDQFPVHVRHRFPPLFHWGTSRSLAGQPNRNAYFKYKIEAADTGLLLIFFSGHSTLQVDNKVGA
jgi:hypothetical protein